MDRSDIYDFLKEHGKQIGIESEQGIPEAIAIVQAYYLYFECPDPGATGLLIHAIGEYEQFRERNIRTASGGQPEGAVQIPG